MPETIDTARLKPGLRHRARSAPILRACSHCGKRTTASPCPDCTRPRFDADPVYRQQRRVVLATADKCWLCGKPETADDPLTADHVEPRALGGNNRGQLKAAHRSCNSRRGATQGVRKISKRSRSLDDPAAVPREKRVESGEAA